MQLRQMFLLWAAAVLLLSEVQPGRAAVDQRRSKRSAMDVNPIERERNYWYEKARVQLDDHLLVAAKPNRNRARNVILFLGDGMSVATVTAARSFLSDAGARLSFERFPHLGLVKTYCIDTQVPDSGATATAFLCGVRARYGTVGVTPKVERGDCETGMDEDNHAPSIAAWAQDAEMWTGLVTTARVTHATPAGLYAHAANRRWEVDAQVAADGCNPRRVFDIARQLVEWPVGRNLHVIMGGGRSNFRNHSQREEDGQRGQRNDGRDLIAQWLGDRPRDITGYSGARYMAHKRDLLLAGNLEKINYLLGLFCPSHCPYHGDLRRDGLTYSVPTLTEMTEAAIRILQKGPHGFFLFVEAGKIDMAHHGNQAQKSLEDTLELHRAVELARNMTRTNDTLIVVTADHGHTMTISGYASRTTDILGLNDDKADDGLPYTILSYANGPGYSTAFPSGGGRKAFDDNDFMEAKATYMAGVPLKAETHSAEDVGVYAVGPYSDYFSGNYEQTNIPIMIAKAAAIGPYAKSRKHDKKIKTTHSKPPSYLTASTSRV